MKKIAGVALLLVLLSYYPVLADSVNLDPGNQLDVTAMTGFATTGSMMNNILVTVFFGNNTSQAASWATTGPGAGGASGPGLSGPGWSLAESGDTFLGGTWTFKTGTDLIKGLSIDSKPGNTVFDIARLSTDPGAK